ncbi:MAG TPA: hypothetical protein VMV29_15455 [Ktedonobacterales bacterium]|nr:hypothetical protein [Ktedonobacterales bacterium]
MAGKRFNPAAHRPKTQRLRVGVRGAAGTRKSTFAASLAEAGLGKLCFFDTELKSCHLPGSDGARFDAYELAEPDELPDAIRWALQEPEGQQQNYGCYSLDSWNGWFGPMYAQFLHAKREKTGEAYPELDGDDLQRLQVVCGEILRPLCIDSKACVVITDTIAGKGLDEQADNEVGRIVPISASGLEYFVDVLVESELRLAEDGIAEVCVHRVVKTNTRAFPIGLTLENPSFKDYLSRLNAGNIANAETIRSEALARDEAPRLTVVAPILPDVSQQLEVLLEKVTRLGYTRENLVTVAKQTFGKYILTDLSADELAVLDQRLEAAAQKRQRQATPAAASGGERKRG